MPIEPSSSIDEQHREDPLQPARSRGIRVLLADDHDILRDGLRALLEMSGDIAVVGEASTGGRLSLRLSGYGPMSSSWISACQNSMGWRRACEFASKRLRFASCF